MKIHEPTKRDNELGIMRLELTGEDIELLDELIPRLQVLLTIEGAMDSVAIQGDSFWSTDVPHVTKEAIQFLMTLVKGWDPEIFEDA